MIINYDPFIFKTFKNNNEKKNIINSDKRLIK